MMKIPELIKEFSKNSRSNQTNFDKVDTKHKRIIKNAEKIFNNLNSKNFRNWSEQGDMGLKYPMTYLAKVFVGSKKNKFLEFFTRIIKKRINHFFEYSYMMDDIEIIKSLGGEKLLVENPQNLTPGAGDFTFIEGFSVSQRWLRYLYIFNQIKKFNLLKNQDLWVDIGSYYGGLQGVVKKYYPEVKMILVDFNHQLTRSYIYLKQLYPDANHIFPNQINSINNIDKLPKGSILYIEVEDFKKINDFKINLTTNFFSLGEMTKETFQSYMESDFMKKSDYIYFANRFCSSPFFEKTYDEAINVFNYEVNKKRLYFDIFPIGQYQISSRTIFNRNFFRNTSSQYFEAIWG